LQCRVIAVDLGRGFEAIQVRAERRLVVERESIFPAPAAAGRAMSVAGRLAFDDEYVSSS
jgi:hypothetical protein